MEEIKFREYDKYAEIGSYAWQVIIDGHPVYAVPTRREAEELISSPDVLERNVLVALGMKDGLHDGGIVAYAHRLGFSRRISYKYGEIEKRMLERMPWYRQRKPVPPKIF